MRTYVFGTYPEFFFERNALRKSFNQFFSEVFVASKIKRLQLFKVLQISEHLAHSFHVKNFVILECHLDHVFSLFEVGQYLDGLFLIND